MTETQTTDNKRCIYCNECKRSDEFSLEHIFPDAMGGNVCRICSRPGMYAGGATR
ncbi:HNH endonuclease [Burkholderia sp. 22PA0106]|uniref:HNH endonuclease n=1 Tax=Burkholderia sp. 22PA0106 TaxID=3237371 RepID=UPI0039C30898